MQAHKQPGNQLEVLTSEVQEIFDHIDKVPYDVIFKTIVLNINNELLSEEMKGNRSELNASTILYKIYKFSNSLVSAYQRVSLKDPSANINTIGADNLVLMMFEAMSRVQGLSHEKLTTMIAFCEKLHKDMEVMQLTDRQMHAFVTFDMAIKLLSQRMLAERNEGNLPEQAAEMKKLVDRFVTLPAIQSKKEIQEIKNEDVIAVFEKDLNIYKALADGDIAKVIKILALLAKYPALVTVVKADIVSAIAKDPLTRTFDQGIEVAEIEKLNAAYLHDPLLTAGINKFFELDNFIHLQQATKISDVEPNNIEVAEAPDHASSKALSELEAFNRKEFQRRSEELSLPDDASKDVDQAKEKKPDSRRYRLISDKMFEWSWSKGFEMLPKSVNQELNMLQQIVNEIRWDAAEFKNPIHKLQAIAFASELQEALFAYVAKTEIKKDNDLTTLKQSFNTARAQVNDLLKHRESNKLNEKIHALFKMIDDMINNTSFSRFLEKKSGYAFYKTKARLLSNIDKVKNPANDPKIPFKKTR